MPVPVLEMADPAGAAASARILAVVGYVGGRCRMCLALRAGRAGFVIIFEGKDENDKNFVDGRRGIT